MTLRQRLTRRWPGAIRRRRACRAWWARAGASVRSWPGGGVGGISLAPGGSGNARPPRACPHRRPAGQGYGGAAAANLRLLGAGGAIATGLVLTALVVLALRRRAVVT